ncbi:hypothetical protein BpHYR1_008454 [Brachionus plicatilis]|uniref:Uncharacterized protein n=1 Tax=Brachionus plicatilis TaxID=10195 RepID=A0A3M7QJK0_BRAPC|nr:hypothetical protein BpHYR1_008454 [Brachionus plicatilis]
MRHALHFTGYLISPFDDTTIYSMCFMLLIFIRAAGLSHIPIKLILLNSENAFQMLLRIKIECFKLLPDYSEQSCKLFTNSTSVKNIINSPLTNENYYPIHLSLEAHILSFALKENRMFWIIHVLSSKSSKKRLELIAEFDDQAQQNSESNFGSTIEKYLFTHPMTFLIIFALSQPLYKLDILLFNEFLENRNNLNGIIEVLMDSDREHLRKIINFFEDHRVEFLSSKKEDSKDILKKSLFDKIKSEETIDIISKLFDKNNNELELNNIECIVRKFCSILDKSYQTLVLNCSSSIELNSFKDLNFFLSKLKSNQFEAIVGILKKLTYQTKSDPFKKCSVNFDSKYCESLRTIISIGANKTEYYVQRINSLLQENNFDFDLTRIVASININKLSKNLIQTYNLLFKNDLIKNMEALFTKKSLITKKVWWKFWENKDGSNDLEIYGRGLMSLLDLDKWCIFECDLTLNRLKNTHDKKRNIEISFHRLTKGTLKWLLRKP